MRFLILTLTLLIAACGGGGESASTAPPPNQPASVERDISPQTINPAALNDGNHVAINPSPNVTATHKLFVFLPGTGGIPAGYRLILRSGASKGFHSLGLNYPNEKAVGELCDTSTDPDCFWKVRHETITGSDDTPLVSVNNSNSIVTRLTDALTYLNQQYPDEGWGQFLSGGSVNWSMVTVAGHSQGGGHAGVLAKLYAMHRVVYFDSPADWGPTTNAPAAWASRANVTAASKQFGFTHVADSLVPLDHLTVTWQAMGLGGSTASVDGASTAQFAGLQKLTTDVSSGFGSAVALHSATVADAATPVVSGVPLFDLVWAYLCFQ